MNINKTNKRIYSIKEGKQFLYLIYTIKEEEIMNKINELKRMDKHQLQSISITSTGGFFNNSESKRTILNYLIRNIDRVKDEHITEAKDIYTTPI